MEDEGDEQLSEEDNTDDDAGRISKLMSSKLGISSNDNDNDDDDGDETRLSKLMSSKLGVGKKDDDDDDDNDDGVRISKLMSSKLSVSGKDADDDNDNVDDSDKDSTEESDNNIRSKLPSRFKLPRKDFEKGKKNRFGHEQLKHVKSNHKRWLENAS